MAEAEVKTKKLIVLTLEVCEAITLKESLIADKERAVGPTIDKQRSAILDTLRRVLAQENT